MLHWAEIADTSSGHPLGRPIIEPGRAEGEIPAPETVEEMAGMGLVILHDGRQVTAGNRRLFDRLGIGFDAEAEAVLTGVLGRGRTPIIVALDGRIAGIFGLSDQPRLLAQSAIARLRDVGVGRIAMLTGDHPQPPTPLQRKLASTRFMPACCPRTNWS